MCGVVAVIGKQNASELVIEGLKKLEYRGYDSAGVASVSNGTLHTIKSEGKLVNLIDKLTEASHSNLQSVTALAMGHTRWATHGNVSVENAHPLTSQNKVAVVHNGIIENYESIKNKLLSEGFIFKSQTLHQKFLQLKVCHMKQLLYMLFRILLLIFYVLSMASQIDLIFQARLICLAQYNYK